jgi:uncharacterized protein (DUF2384 family)
LVSPVGVAEVLVVTVVVGGDFGRKRERERELTTEPGRRVWFVAGVLVGVAVDGECVP